MLFAGGTRITDDVEGMVPGETVIDGETIGVIGVRLVVDTVAGVLEPTGTQIDITEMEMMVESERKPS